VIHEEAQIRIPQVQEDLHMLIPFATMVLAEAQQAHHLAPNWRCTNVSRQTKRRSPICGGPNGRLLADYREANRCYVQFHLYRVADCSSKLATVEIDLGDLQIARTESR
jgi:hypothetical protein